MTADKPPSDSPERKLTEKQMDDWLLACEADPSLVTPHEMGWLPDGTRRFAGD